MKIGNLPKKAMLFVNRAALDGKGLPIFFGLKTLINSGRVGGRKIKLLSVKY